VIRVVRIMEYEYETQEQADADMARWQVPAIGNKKFGTAGPLIKSTILLPHYKKELSQEEAIELTRQLPDPNDLVGKEMTVTVPKEGDEPTNTGWVNC
jgi:hypothetical protein